MKTIHELRDDVDKIDAAIIEKLAQRKILSEKIGFLKSQLDIEVIDSKREEELISHYEKLCNKYKLEPKFIKQLFQIIIEDSRKLQN